MSCTLILVFTHSLFSSGRCGHWLMNSSYLMYPSTQGGLWVFTSPQNKTTSSQLLKMGSSRYLYMCLFESFIDQKYKVYLTSLCPLLFGGTLRSYQSNFDNLVSFYIALLIMKAWLWIVLFSTHIIKNCEWWHHILYMYKYISCWNHPPHYLHTSMQGHSEAVSVGTQSTWKYMCN